jgi:S-formylglutathione hydrolase
VTVPGELDVRSRDCGADAPEQAYDACELLKTYAGPKRTILVDQGTKDSFLETQLRPQSLADAAKAAAVPLTLRMQEGYTHSYFFIASFMEDHLRHHATALLPDSPAPAYVI